MSELGDFLRTRRARLTPEEVGLTSYGARRRVPGLRREELAQLAGVSVAYYTRLEQGQSRNASDSVLEAVSRALRLDDDERAHLLHLARPVKRQRAAAPRPETARPATRQLVEALDTVPAAVLDRRTNVLAWNGFGHALLAGHLAFDDRPNLARLLFLDPHTRELYPRWEEEARVAIASLRMVAGENPEDRALAELIGELSMKSREFTALWARHPVRTCTFGVKLLHHPLVGEMELNFENMVLPDDSGQRVLMYSAAPGSAARGGLDLLRAMTAGTADPAASADVRREAVDGG